MIYLHHWCLVTEEWLELYTCISRELRLVICSSYIYNLYRVFQIFLNVVPLSKMFSEKDPNIFTKNSCWTIFTGPKNPQAVQIVNIIFAASLGSLWFLGMSLREKGKTAKEKNSSLERMPKPYVQVKQTKINLRNILKIPETKIILVEHEHERV